MDFLEKPHPTPPLLNPAKNPLLPWLFAPFGFCLGLVFLYWAVEQEYFQVLKEFESCTILRNYQKSKKLVNSMFQCAEDLDQKFYFRSRVRNTDEILDNLEGKKVSFIFQKSFICNDVDNIKYENNFYEGRTALTDGYFFKVILLITGTLACCGAILIWILRFRWKE